jgi:hypothetical protein
MTSVKLDHLRHRGEQRPRSRGSVQIDGLDVPHVRQASLAAAIGFVTQESYLFHDSILANIRYGRPAASAGQAVAPLAHDRAVPVGELHDPVVDVCRAGGLFDFGHGCTRSSSKAASSNGSAPAVTSWPTAPSGTGNHSPRLRGPSWSC